MQPNKARADLWMDLGLVAFLIAFDVAARLLPHAPGVWPFAATALFAGRMLRVPALAVDRAARRRAARAMWRSRATIGGLPRWSAPPITLPAFAGMLARRWHGAIPVIAGDGVVLADLFRRPRISRSGPSTACIR